MSDKKNIENSDQSTVPKAQDSTLTTDHIPEDPSPDAPRPKAKPKQSFTDRWKYNRFWLIRASYHVLRTIWIIVMAIGAFIAWLISLLFI